MDGTTEIIETTKTDTDIPAEDVKDKYPASFSSSLSVILLFQMLTGLLCNFTVLGFSRCFKLKKRVVPSSLARTRVISYGAHTTINSILITNLSVVDILICLLSIPLTLTYIIMGRNHPFLFCLCHEATVSFTTSSSALNLLIISINRYQTIVAPFKRCFRSSDLVWVLTIVWTLSILGFCVPFLSLAMLDWQDTATSKMAPCFSLLNTHSPGHHFFFEMYYVCIYTIACIVVIVCYTQIFRAAHKRINTRVAIIRSSSIHVPTIQNEGASRASKNNDKTMTKMTLMIVSTFVVCWAPHSVASIVSMAVDNGPNLEMSRLICITLAYMATLAHPLLYTFMRQNFKTAIIDSLSSKKKSDGLPHAPGKSGIRAPAALVGEVLPIATVSRASAEHDGMESGSYLTFGKAQHGQSSGRSLRVSSISGYS